MLTENSRIAQNYSRFARTMALVFEEMHAAPDRKRTNEEWFVLANHGPAPVSTAGLRVIVAARGKRGSILGQIDPGFVLQPGEKILIVSGIPGRKSHGTPPERDGLRTYHLLSPEPLLRGDGTTLKLALNQLELVKGVYSASAPAGVAPRD